MSFSNTAAATPQQDYFQRCKLELLTGTNLSQRTPSVATKISGWGLITASALFGSVYAWQVGSQNTTAVLGIPVLAIAAVLMALSLELAKPFAVASAMASFRSFAFVQGVLLTVLALATISYSLTAELSLAAMLRFDSVAHREAVITAATAQNDSIRRAGERYDVSRRELESLAPARASGEVQAEIESLLLTRGAGNCAVVDGPVTRRVCPRVADLRIELARAQRREQLKADMMSAAKLPLQRVPLEPVSVADPGATALATYLSEVGFVAQPTLLSQWLVLIPVLALEIGSAVAAVLIRASAQPSQTEHRQLEPLRTADSQGVLACSTQVQNSAAGGNVHTPQHSSPRASKHRGKRSQTQERRASTEDGKVISIKRGQSVGRDEAALRVMHALRLRNGDINSSLRTFAKELSVSVGTLRGAIAKLVSTGEIISIPSPTGTAIRIAA